MPVALETSKRKFNKLLDSLTGASSAERPLTPSTSNIDGDGASKRQRLTPRSRLAASHPLVNSSTNLRAIRRVPSSAVTGGVIAANANGIEHVPNYAPWNKQHFQTRLKTFTNVASWGTKPESINEVAWAKRGWICETRNRVACKGGCEERIVLSLRPKVKDAEGKDIDGTEDFSVEVSDDLVKRYEQLIIEGHKDDCLWRGAGCSDDIMRMPLARPSIWQPDLKERYWSLLDAKTSLPSLSRIKQPCEIDSIVAQLGPDFFHKNSEAAKEDEQHEAIDIVALSFAMLGWTVPKGDGQSLYATATCSECFRRVGLWLYNDRPPSSSSARASNVVPPTSSGESRISSEAHEINQLDLAESHRGFCPWVNAASQATPGPLSGQSGWQILQKVISNWAALRARASRAQSRGDSAASPPVPLAQETEGEHDVLAEDVQRSQMSPAESLASRDEIRKQDNARFARLRELSRRIGFKNFGAPPGGKENRTAL